MRFDSKQFFLDIIIVFEVTHLWYPEKMANKWPSRFHHPQKWTIGLLFKIMESTNTWHPLPTLLLCGHHKRMFPFWFFKVWSVTYLQMKFWILWKFSQVIFCQAIKETKQAYISNYISYFLNNFLVSLCQ